MLQLKSGDSSAVVESSVLPFLSNGRYSQCKIERLDKGSYGIVFKITKNKDKDVITEQEQQVMALKVMKNVDQFDINEGLKEATKMLKYANMNCNIAKVFEVFLLDTQLFGFEHNDEDKPFKEKYLCIEMEYYQMGSLHSVFRNERPTTSIIKQILAQVVTAFKNMQECDQLIHNDVKPNNILVKSFSKHSIQIVLSDFGKAITVQEAIQITPYASSTKPFYPNSELPSKSADIYALALTIYEITTKKLSQLNNGNGKFDEEKVRQDYEQAGISDHQLINLLILMMNGDAFKRPSCDEILNSVLTNNLSSQNTYLNTMDGGTDSQQIAARPREIVKLDFQRFSNLLQAQVDVLSETLYYLSEEKTHQQIDNIEFENHWKLLCQFKQPEQLLNLDVFHCAKDMMSIQEAAEKSAIELDDTIRKIQSYDKFIDSHQSELLKYSIWKHYITSLKKYYEQFKEKVSKVYNMDGFINLSMKPYTMCGDFFKRPFMKISSSQIQLITNGFEKINKTSSTSNHSVTHLPIDQAEYYFKKNGSPNLNPSMEFALISLYQVLDIDTIETGLVIAMDQCKTSYLPIQISTAITGCKHEEPEQLDQECFEKQVLGVLLTCPSDGKPNNYVLTSLQNSMNEYISIDNDEVFSNLIEKGYNNLKNFLLTLPNMNRRITKKTIEFFINTPPFLLILEWINKLSEKEKEYEALMKFSRFKTQVNNENCCVDFFSDLKPTTIRNILNVFNRIVACFKDNKNPTLNDVFKKCYPINFEYYKNKSYEMIHTDTTKLNIKNEEFTFDNSIHDGEEHDHVAINPFNDEHIQKQKQKIKQLKETLTEIIMNEGHHFIDDTIKYLIRKLDEKNIEYVIQKMSVIIEEDYLLEHQQFNIDFICELFSKGLALAKKYNISQEWINLFTKFRMYSSDLNWKLLIEQYFERRWTSNPLTLPKKYNEIKGAISFERTLSKEMANVIFDTKKQFKKDNTLSGRSQTTKWPTEKPIFYFKKYPEFPGLEFASTLFMRHLGMKKVPHSELFMFYDELMNEHYPVLVIESMDGDIIAKKWDNDSIFNNLENYETSLLILSSLLLNPEDQKEDNLLISNDGKYLIPIDNDRNFLPGIIYNKDSYWFSSTINTSLQCKSFVFCLNEMHKPLQSKIIEFIRSMNIEIFIENWLKHLSKINELYQQLFTNDIWDQHNVKLKIEIRKEYIDNLYQKLYMLRTLLLEEPNTTPFQFLKISDPLLFKEYSLTQPKTKKALFLQVTSKYYTSSQRISRITTCNSKMLMKIQTSNMNDWEGPQCLLDHFKTLCKNNNLEIEIISKYLKEEYLGKKNEKEIIELLFNSTNILSIVSVYKSEQLNDSLFTNQYFIGKSNYIKVLDLRYCKKLKEGTLKLFQDKCTLLEYLNISGWNITKFGCYKIVKGIFTDSVEIDTTKECFPKLSRLIAKDCSYLRTVHLIQNSLISVELGGCSKLESIILTAKHLSILDLRNTENVITLSVHLYSFKFSYLSTGCKTWKAILMLPASKPALERGFVLEAVKQNGGALKYADDLFKKDREIVLKAVKQNGWALEYADDLFKKDREIVLEAVKQDGGALKYVDDLFKKDREIVLKAVKQDGWALKYADDLFKKDREFLLEAVKQNGWALEYADDLFKKDREIVLDAVKQNGGALEYADDLFKKDREIVLKAVKQDGWALKYADDLFKKDREIVLEAVKQRGGALKYADDLFKKDREIVLKAVKQNGWALEYADYLFKKDREIVLDAVKQNGGALGYADDLFKKDREIVLEAVKQDGGALKYVDDLFKKDREIVLEAVKQRGVALKYADDLFKKDREIVLKAVKQDGGALVYADDLFKKDREIVLEAGKQNGAALVYADYLLN